MIFDIWGTKYIKFHDVTVFFCFFLFLRLFCSEVFLMTSLDYMGFGRRGQHQHFHKCTKIIILPVSELCVIFIKCVNSWDNIYSDTKYLYQFSKCFTLSLYTSKYFYIVSLYSECSVLQASTKTTVWNYMCIIDHPDSIDKNCH